MMFDWFVDANTDINGVKYEYLRFDPNHIYDWSVFESLFKLSDDERNCDPPSLGFDPDYDNYINMDRCGNLVFIAARKNDVPIGYVIFSVWRHYNDKKLKVAQRRAQYVMPKFRGKGIATRMLDMAHCELKSRGVRLVLMNTREDRPQKLGYKRMETVWYKEL